MKATAQATSQESASNAPRLTRSSRDTSAAITPSIVNTKQPTFVSFTCPPIRTREHMTVCTPENLQSANHIAAPIKAAADFFAAGSGEAYTSSVRAAEECPRMLCSVFTSIWARMQAVANVCRRS